MFTVYHNLCMMNKWWASKITKKIIDQTVLTTESRPISKYVAYIVNEFRHTLAIKRHEKIFQELTKCGFEFRRQKRVPEFKFLEY